MRAVGCRRMTRRLSVWLLCVGFVVAVSLARSGMSGEIMKKVVRAGTITKDLLAGGKWRPLGSGFGREADTFLRENPSGRGVVKGACKTLILN